MQQHRYLNHLIDPRFQGVNRLFVLSFKNYAQGTSNKEYFLPNVKIKDCNVMIDRKCFFDQLKQNDKITHHIKKFLLDKNMIKQLVV